MTPDERRACLAALEAAEKAAEALRAVLAADTAGRQERLSLAQASQLWGVSKEAARQRARRGAGIKVAGRWQVPADAVQGTRQPLDM